MGCSAIAVPYDVEAIGSDTAADKGSLAAAGKSLCIMLGNSWGSNFIPVGYIYKGWLGFIKLGIFQVFARGLQQLIDEMQTTAQLNLHLLWYNSKCLLD